MRARNEKTRAAAPILGVIRSITDSIREQFGHPSTLIQLLARQPDARVNLNEPELCIHARSITRWDQLGGASGSCRSDVPRGVLTGWKWGGESYHGFLQERAEYASIGQRTITPDWTCDISDVHGFSGSKSDLFAFRSTDEMVERNSRDMIDEISLAKLEKNLAHDQIRIFPDRGASDFFARYQWDGRLWLMNDGGSHHFAAAKYIATRLGRPVPLMGSLYTYSLNGAAIASLRRDFEIFVISDDPPIANAFLDALKAFKATWLWHDMPRPFGATRAILLPRSERRSMRVAAELRDAGILDLGSHLTGLLARQHTSQEMALAATDVPAERDHSPGGAQ